MKNAAVILGVIGGVVGMIVGFFAYGWVEFTDWFNTEVQDVIEPTANSPAGRL